MHACGSSWPPCDSTHFISQSDIPPAGLSHDAGPMPAIARYAATGAAAALAPDTMARSSSASLAI